MATAAAPSARIVRDTARWYSEGRRLKAEARRRRVCVECRDQLPSGRSPYCGRICQWRFRGRFFWDAARVYVVHRDRFTCQHCGDRRRVGDLEVDHIVEIARGGPSLSYDNLQTLCRRCHRAKTSRYLRVRARARAESPGAGTVAPLAYDGSFDWFPA